MPKWILGDIFDVRMAVMNWVSAQPTPATQTATRVNNYIFSHDEH